MQNEPNLKNTKMNLNLFKTTNYSIFRPLQRRKNEPNSNPIYGKRPQFTLFEQFPLIYEIFSLIFTNFYTFLHEFTPGLPIINTFEQRKRQFSPPRPPKKTNPICSRYAVMACSSACPEQGAAASKGFIYLLRPTFASHESRATIHKQKNAKRTQFKKHQN